MRHHNTIFHALLKQIPRHRFQAIVDKYKGDYRVRNLNCWSQFVSMLYAQLSGVSSLRDLILSLDSHRGMAYHLGLKTVRRSTLSDANAKRSTEPFEAVFQMLLGQLSGKELRQAKEVEQVLRLIDATPLHLGLRCSDWAKFSKDYVGAKVHVCFDPNGKRPVYFSMTKSNVNDITAAQDMPLEPGATYVFDKAYYSFSWWQALDEAQCTFVTRLKKNALVNAIKERKTDSKYILSDMVFGLTQRLSWTRKNPYKKPLREICVKRDDGQILRLVTNDLNAPAEQIAELYKKRWQIELFFKWIKQNLKIKCFFGTSENAVKLQVIIAMIAYLLIRLTQESLMRICSLLKLTRLIKANLMQRKTLMELIKPPPYQKAQLPQMEMAI